MGGGGAWVGNISDYIYLSPGAENVNFNIKRPVGL